jgi:hypothetical protein
MYFFRRDAANLSDIQSDALKSEIMKGVKSMSEILLAVVCLIVGFGGGYFFGKTKMAKEFETKAGKIGDVMKQ